MTNKELISKTLARRMMACIHQYEAIKRKESSTFKTVKEFCLHHKFSHQNFMKIYHRFKQDPFEASLLPQKRGPKFQKRRTELNTENRIIELRSLGNNKYDIKNILQNEAKTLVPSLTTIYNIFKKHGLNKLNPTQKEVKRKIIMSRIGELIHIDCHQLSRGITIAEPNKTYYLVGLIDGYSRLAWVEVMENKKAIKVMFAILKSFNMLKNGYGVEVEAVMTDNGAEFGSGAHAKNKDSHPLEVLLSEMGVKHRYTRPYRPQTNGKIERFWRTLKEDFLEDALYNDIEDMKEELLKYMVYYNEHRGHSSLSGKTPKEFAIM